MSTDRSKKFTTMPGEIESLGLSIPKRLKGVVADAPRGGKAIKDYLNNLVKAKTITTDEKTFLIDSGALQLK